MIERNPQGRAVLDGAIVAAEAVVLPWSDPAAQWGLGVFETLAVGSGTPRHFDEHLLRLNAAAERLAIPLPSIAELARAVHLVAEGADAGGAWLKVVLSRSGRWAVFAGPHDPKAAGGPVSAVVLPWRRHRLDPTAGIKSTAYAACLIGLTEARRRGADEGLWLNDRGHLVSACTANLFVVRGRAAVTPALSDGARDGVTRERAIAALRALGLSVRQSKIRPAALRAGDEVFLTGSLTGVRPVVRIDGRDVRGGRTGATTRRVAERLIESGAPHDAVDGSLRRGE